jgi:hypothetical protein
MLTLESVRPDLPTMHSAIPAHIGDSVSIIRIINDHRYNLLPFTRGVQDMVKLGSVNIKFNLPKKSKDKQEVMA